MFVTYYVQISILYNAFLFVCLSVCFNSSKTVKGTSIKLGTIDHRPVVSVIREFMTS